MFSKVKIVNKGLKVKLYPYEDMEQKINQNIGNARFVWNKMLEQYNTSLHNGENLACNYTTFNTILTQLKKENDFLYKSESSSLQQVYRDLIRAFNNFFDERADYPRFKSKKNPKHGFRIQNNNNIKINNNTIKLPVLGEIHYRTSPFYKQLLQESKINNVTIKIENGHYYAVFNIETTIEEFKKEFETVGIDLGVRTLATLSNELKITNLDVTREDKMIKKYYRKLSRQKYKSNRYNKTLKTLSKWIQRKKNRLNDAYHKLSNYLVKNYDLIAMETLDIKEMFQDKILSPKLQTQGLYKLVEMIKYKCEWYGKHFIQISQWFPSSKKCSHCGHIYQELNRQETQWTCTHCKTKHDRDLNAAKNIEEEGIRIFRENTLNLWNRGDSTVILLSLESTSP